MVFLFYFQITLLLFSLAWDLHGWVVAWQHSRELKRKHIGYFGRLRDAKARYLWKCAAQDTAMTFIFATVCSFMASPMIGGPVGAALGIFFSVLQRRENKKDLKVAQ